MTIKSLVLQLSLLFIAIAISTDLECQQVYYTSWGTFSSPSFLSRNGSRKNDVCKWRIVAAPGEKIVVNVTNLKIEKSVDCSSAYLEIRDGFWHNSPLIGRFCGEGQLDPIASTRNQMLVTYNPANVQKPQGFFAKYEATCGRDLFVENQTILQSPNYPNKYPLNKRCIWRIVVPENHRVVLKFQTFHLENHSNCLYDFVEIRDGFTSDSNLIGVFCQEIPPEFVSSTNSLWIKFVSDASNQNQGFSATIMEEYDECGMNHECAQECINTMGGYQCACRPGFRLHSNGRDCEDDCGGSLEGPNGTITSPSYPDPYPANKTCIWEIVTEPQNRILLNFTHFDLNGINSRKQRCKVDRVEIFSKFPDGSVRRHGVYCGSMLPEAISSETNALKIEFRSGRGGNKSGFAIDYFTGGSKCAVNNGNCRHKCLGTPNFSECLCTHNHTLQNNGQDCVGDCHHEISSPSGTISTPNFPMHYPNNKHCRWLFTSTPGHRIKIAFLFFETEANDCRFDNVVFYDGCSTLDNSLGKYCGATWPPSITSSRNELLVTFQSDGFDNYDGFEASYSSICGGTLLASGSERYIYSHTTFGTTDYRSSTDCEWIVKPDSDHTTNLTFTSFELEDTEDCQYDYVEILKLVDSDYVSVGRFCGNNTPPNIIWNNSISIRFRSDDNVADKGFSLIYRSIMNFPVISSA